MLEAANAEETERELSGKLIDFSRVAERVVDQGKLAFSSP